MSKLLTTILATSALVYAATSEEAQVTAFLKQSIKTGEQYSLKNVEVTSSSPMEAAPGWKSYFVKVTLELTQQKREIALMDIVFSDGKNLTKELFDLKTGKNLKERLSPDIDPVLYDEAHLIEGSFTAANKLLVFSDPLCPFCIDFVPELIQLVRANPQHFALFYYHRPLMSIHPSAVGLIKAMEAAKRKGVKDIVLKTYEEVFDITTNDEAQIMAIFNKALKINVTLEEMNNPEIIKELEHDMSIAKEMLINSTPVLFVNGKRDNDRIMHKKLLKEKN